MPSRNTYLLTWVSLTFDVGYLFTVAPAKRSHCSLPWRRGIFSWPPPDLERGVAPLGPPAPGSSGSLEVVLLLSAAAPALSQPGTLGRYPRPWARCSSSRPCFCAAHHSQYLGQTMVEVMKIMVTSFKRSHAHTATPRASSPAAGHC